MGVCSDGSYSIQPDLIFSMPVTIDKEHNWKIVQVGIKRTIQYYIPFVNAGSLFLIEGAFVYESYLWL